MTDIVIKPSNSGGSVKLQTEGGTNGLTMASTGDLTTSGNVAVTGTMTGGTLGSGVIFPSGQVLQTQYDSYSTQTTIGNTNTYILTSTFSTRGTNSRILVLTNLLYGASGDALGFHGGITMTSGSNASTDYDGDAIQLGATTEGTTGKLFQDDIGNGRLNGYGIQVWYANASKVTSFATDTQITVGLWLNGDNTMYINRCESRGNINEMNISTMTVFEIAT